MKNIILVIFVCLITGCAAKVKQSVTTSNITSGSMPSSILLDIQPSRTITRSTDLSKSMLELNKLIAKEYRGDVLKGNTSNQAEVSVNITVEHFRYVSGFGRFMTGVMAGDAELKLNVQLLDSMTNEVISESVFDTRSEFSEGIFGVTTSRQLQALSKEIVNLINSSGKRV